ncbi:NlpC/P60 family protein [Sporolactobacillus sp. THM7-7]|nr:NlpC/P60 family protein [Sporolactobacillus sp. THM7-7]
MHKKQAAVPVVTVWSDPDAVRPVDAPAVGDRADLASWISGMTREENIALCDEKRVQTQVLFGDELFVDSVHGHWAKIVVPAQASAKDTRGYPGWVPIGQLADGTPRSSESREKVMVQSKQATFFNGQKDQIFDLSFATFLPLVDEGEEEIKADSPVGEGFVRRKDVIFPNRHPSGNGKDVVRNAERFLGLTYLWGGMSAYGYDCSGFSYSMLRAAGYTIPRDAADQSRNGKAIAPKEMMPGDLLFFAYEEGKGAVHHVGICAGGGEMIHSPTPGKKISLTVIRGTIFEKELCAVRRYWKEG